MDPNTKHEFGFLVNRSSRGRPRNCRLTLNTPLVSWIPLWVPEHAIGFTEYAIGFTENAFRFTEYAFDFTEYAFCFLDTRFVLMNTRFVSCFSDSEEAVADDQAAKVHRFVPEAQAVNLRKVREPWTILKSTSCGCGTNPSTLERWTDPEMSVADIRGG